MATEIRNAGDQYALVAASQTAVVLGGGHAGGRITGVLLVPSSTSPGSVTLIDSSGSSIVLFQGGVSSLPSLAPIFLGLSLVPSSPSGVWSCTTGANIACVFQGVWE